MFFHIIQIFYLSPYHLIIVVLNSLPYNSAISSISELHSAAHFVSSNFFFLSFLVCFYLQTACFGITHFLLLLMLKVGHYVLGKRSRGRWAICKQSRGVAVFIVCRSCRTQRQKLHLVTFLSSPPIVLECLHRLFKEGYQLFSSFHCFSLLLCRLSSKLVRRSIL